MPFQILVFFQNKKKFISSKPQPFYDFCFSGLFSAQFFTFGLFIVTLAILLTVAVLFVHHKGNVPVPKTLKTLCFRYLAVLTLVYVPKTITKPSKVQSVVMASVHSIFKITNTIYSWCLFNFTLKYHHLVYYMWMKLCRMRITIRANVTYKPLTFHLLWVVICCRYIHKIYVCLSSHANTK